MNAAVDVIVTVVYFEVNLYRFVAISTGFIISYDYMSAVILYLHIDNIGHCYVFFFFSTVHVSTRSPGQHLPRICSISPHQLEFCNSFHATISVPGTGTDLEASNQGMSGAKTNDRYS